MKIYHDADENGVWTRISAITQFPIIPNRMDETSQIGFVIGDFEGALYSTWEGYDWIPLKVTDEAGVVLFRGFLTNKKYNANSLVCIARGLSAKLDWTPINKNYIYKEGTVKDVGPMGDGDVLELQDIDGGAITWANDELINGRETGILIRDTSPNWDTTTWIVSTISDVNEVSNAGNAANCNTDDGTYYQTNDSGILDAITTPVITGANIDSTAKKLKEIVIHYKIGTYFKGIPVDKTITFEIEYNGTNWVEIFKRSSGGTDIREVWTSSSFTIPGTDTELAKYLTKTGDNYDGITNIRIKMESVTSTEAFVNYIKIDFLTAEIKYYETDITPISEPITDNGNTWIEASGIDFLTAGVVGESAPGEMDGDSFMIGYSTTQILNEIFGVSSVGLQIDTTLTKIIAQQFKGTNAKEVLNKIILLEGVHWFEDHVLNQVRIAKEADMVDSTEDLTQGDYDHGWELEDDNNYYSAVEVYGCAGYNIYYKDIDPDYPAINKSPMTFTIIEETIMTKAEARDIAEAKLLELKDKRPSIRIPLKGVYTNLRIGKTVGLTMARPTRAEADYPIRMIERKRLGHGEIKTTIYCGLGHSTLEEKVTNNINKGIYLAHKAHTDRLISTNYAPGVSPSWGDIGGATAGVEAVITAQLVNGQSIDNAIDTLIATVNEISEMFDIDLTGIADENILVYESDDGKFYDKTPAEYADMIEDQLQIIEAQITDLDKYTQAQIGALKLNFWVAPDSNIAMGNFHFTGMAAGADANDSVRFAQLHTIATVSAPLTVVGQLINLENQDGGVITEIDTDALANSDTKIPTNTTVVEYIGLRKLSDFVAPASNLAMANFHLTGLANGADATDSMAFGQKYTDAAAKAASITAGAYNAVGWNGVTTGATQDAIRDELEAMKTETGLKQTAAQVETIIDNNINPGQDIDNAIDALILAHKNGADNHHVAFVAGDADLLYGDIANEHTESHLLHAHVAPTSDIAMGTKHFTGIGDGAAATDSVAYGQVSSAIGHDHQHNISVALLEDVVMYGSANAAWIPCAYSVEGHIPEAVYGGGQLRNTGAVDAAIMYTCPLPTNKNGLKLYVSGWGVELYSADNDDYLTSVTLYGADFDSLTSLNSDASDVKTAQSLTDTFVAVDCSSYKELVMYLGLFCTTVGHVGVRGVYVRCYYYT